MQAIQTNYKGYRFRSRLEARWAVFFDSLDIEWEYEPEGFDSGTRYLPDFHLPGLNYWIEIKGKEPSLGEMQKLEDFAHALDEERRRLFKEAQAEARARYPIIKTFLDFTAQTRIQFDGLLVQHADRTLADEDRGYEQAIANMTDAARDFFTAAEDVEQFLIDLPFTEELLVCIGQPWRDPQAGKFEYSLHLVGGGKRGYFEIPMHWIACDECGNAFPSWNDDEPERCVHCENSQNTPAAAVLVKAYSAARQARFEFGETPR